MKKISRIILLFALIVSLSIFAFAENAYEQGDVLEFGEFPQTLVSDEAVTGRLDALLAEDGWVSYGYFSGDGTYGSMARGDFMKYQDVLLNGVKYRAVLSTETRPVYSKDPAGEKSYYIINGYSVNTVYWFAFEPIRWKVLDPVTGLLFAENILSAQALNDIVAAQKPGSSEYYIDDEGLYFANDYAHGTLREWLNGPFYDTAFSEEEKECITVSEVDNSLNAYSTEEYTCENTFDRIFIPGITEFNTPGYFPDTAAFIKTGTDYARAEGLAHYNTVGSGDYWQLRSNSMFGSRQGAFITDNGVFSAGNETDGCDLGVVPMLRADLSAVKALKEGGGKEDLYRDFTFTFDSGVLVIDGTGTLPDPDASSTDPLSPFREDAAVIMLGSGVSAADANAFRGFENAGMLIADGHVDFRSGSLTGASVLSTVMLRGGASLETDVFAPAAKRDIYVREGTEFTGEPGENTELHRYSFADGVLRIGGTSKLNYYDFLDLISVFCGEYDDIALLSFESFVSGDIYFHRHNDETGKDEVIHGVTLENTEFAVSAKTDEGARRVTYNELSRMAGEGTLKEFYLSVSADGYDDLEDNTIQLLERMLLRALKWIVGLLNTIFNFFTKLLS